jgi:hypothetical protein
MICGQSLALGTPAISLNGSAPPGQHARAHYQQTGYPPAARLESGSPWRSSYIRQRPV